MINLTGINFKSRPIYTAKLKQPLFFFPALKTEKNVYISELEASDEKRMGKLLKSWCGTTYGGYIIKNFLEEIKTKLSSSKLMFKRFYIVENSKGDIKGLAMAEINQGSVNLALLQSEREKKGKRAETKIAL